MERRKTSRFQTVPMSDWHVFGDRCSKTGLLRDDKSGP